MTEVDAPWGKGRGGGRSEKVDVNHPKFFDRYSRSIEQQPKMRIKQNEIKQNKISKVLIICFSQLQHIFKRELMFFCLWFLKQMTLRHGCSPVNLLHIFGTLFLKNISGRQLLIVVISFDISQTKLDKLDHSFNNMFNKIKYYFLGEFRGYPTPLTCSKNLNLWSFEQSVNLWDLILLNLPDLLLKT